MIYIIFRTLTIDQITSFPAPIIRNQAYGTEVHRGNVKHLADDETATANSPVSFATAAKLSQGRRSTVVGPSSQHPHASPNTNISLLRATKLIWCTHQPPELFRKATEAVFQLLDDVRPRAKPLGHLPTWFECGVKGTRTTFGAVRHPRCGDPAPGSAVSWLVIDSILRCSVDWVPSRHVFWNPLVGNRGVISTFVLEGRS